MPKGGRRRTEEPALLFSPEERRRGRRQSESRHSLLKERRGCKPSQDTFSRLYTCSREEGPCPTIFDVSVQRQWRRRRRCCVCVRVQSRDGTVSDSLAMRRCCLVPWWRRRRSLCSVQPRWSVFSLLPVHPIIQSGRWQSSCPLSSVD